MRDYQARMIVYIILYGEIDDHEVHPLIWPAASDGTPAPLFPHDGFYDDSFRRDSTFGYYLTRAMTLAFVGGENPMWVDEYGGAYYGYRLWPYYMRDTEPSTGTGTLELAGHDRLPAITAHHSTTDPSTKFFLHGEDFVTPTGLVPSTSAQTPESITVTTENYGAVFEFLKAALTRLKRIDMVCSEGCGPTSAYRSKLYHQTEDITSLGNPVYENLYAYATNAAQTWWNDHSWDTCTTGGLSIGPPEALEDFTLIKSNPWQSQNGVTRWRIDIDANRRAGTFFFDYHSLHSPYEVYLAIEPQPEGAAFTPSIPVDGKYHLLHAGSGPAKYQSETFGYSTSAPLSTDAPTDPTCSLCGETTVRRRRGWAVHLDGVDTVNAALVVFSPDFDAIAKAGAGSTAGCVSCGGDAVPGAPRIEATTAGGVTTASIGWSLGRSVTGAASGTLSMQTAGLSADAIRPLALIAGVRGSAQYSVGAAPTNGNGKPVTISTGNAVIVVEDTTSGTNPLASTTISTYLGTLVTGSPYQTTVLAYREETSVANPAAPTTSVAGKTLTVTTTGQCPSQSRFTQVDNNWEMATGFDGTNYLRRERIVREPNATTAVVKFSHTVVGPDNVVVTLLSESTKSFPWGTEIVERTSGQTGVGMGIHGQTYSYHEDATIAGTPNPNYTHLKSVVTTEGAWRHYEYDAAGAVVTEIAQFQGSTYGTSLSTLIAQGRSRNTTFATATVASSTTAEVTQTVEKLQGVEVTRTCTLSFLPAQGKYAGTDESEVWTIRCAVPDAQTGTTLSTYLSAIFADPWTVADQVEVTVSEATGLHRVKRRMHADGTMSIHLYNLNSTTFARTTTTYSGPANTSRTAIRGGTRNTTVVNAQGVAVSSVTVEFDPAGDPVVVSQTVIDNLATDIDDYGRVLKWLHFDGTFTQTHYDCCGKDYTLDAAGVKTTYTYDALKREIASARQVGPTVSTVTPMISTITTYDADSRVLTESRKGTDDSTMLLSSNLYDLGGRMISTKNALEEETVYAETFSSPYVISTVTSPDPDGSGLLSAPISVRVSYADGSPVSVNVPFTASQSASAPQQFASGTATLSGAIVRTSTVYASDNTTLSAAYPRTISYTNALGQTIKSKSSLSSTAWAEQVMSYDPATHIRTQVDPDGVRTFQVSGYGTADAATYLGYTVPTALELYFKCRWSITALDVNGDGAISFVGTSGGPADRITLTSSWLGTRSIVSGTIPVRRSATIVWNSDSSSSSFIETSSSDSTLDGLKSWSASFQNYSSSETVNDTSSTSTHFGRTVTTTDPSGGTIESREEFGRQVYTTRTHVGSVFGGKTMFEYDAHGRLSKTHMLRTASATWNGTGDDVTETTYDAVDRAYVVTAPSPYGGTGSGSGTRHVSTYTYDHLGRVIQVDLPGSKNTKSTYTAQGQVETVRGFGVNPVDYAYDKLGRMTELSTYQNVGGSSTGKATTSWAYDSYSGRLLNKRYQGNTGGTPDLAYTYKDSGRPLTRTTKRGIVTTYAYDSHTGEPISTNYTDSTPAVLLTKRDRLGRVTETVDAAGKHTLAYLNDGRSLSETIAADTGISGAPHTNYLSGITLTNTFSTVGSTTSDPNRTPRASTEVTAGSAILNHVDFAYDMEHRITELTKSYGRVAYEYDPITGQVTFSTSKVSNGGSTYSGRIRGGRTYDRLGRLSGIQWLNVPTSGLSAGFVNRMYGTDVHGRRTSMLAGVDEHSEDWAYGYDDKNQLTSGLASFSNTSPAVVVPGLQFGYTYDDIGNRTQTVQGDALTGSSAFPATYVPNPLNQYDSRTVPGKIEVTGHSLATDVYVNSTTSAAYRYMDDDGFFHDRLSVNNSAGPERTLVQIQDAPPMGAAASYDVYTPAAAEAFTYDADGNLATDGIWTYTWDAENRLTRMVMNPGIIGVMVGQSQAWMALSFRYDGMGRRILKQLDNSTDYTNQIQKGDLSSAEFSTSYIRKYVYDIGSWNLSTVLRQSGSTYYADQTFAWGPDLSGTENGAGGIGGLAIYVDDFNDGGEGAAIGPMFPVYDGNGNVLRLYDGHRDTAEMPDHKLAEYKYGPFGEQRGQTGSQATRFPFRWSTKFTDNETGLVYYGYRYYSPSMGRWIARDPIAEVTDALLYRSTSNAPVNYMDFHGQYATTLLGADAIFWDLQFLNVNIPLTRFGLNTGGLGFNIVGGMQLVANCRSQEFSLFAYAGFGISYSPIATIQRAIGLARMSPRQLFLPPPIRQPLDLVASTGPGLIFNLENNAAYANDLFQPTWNFNFTAIGWSGWSNMNGISANVFTSYPFSNTWGFSIEYATGTPSLSGAFTAQWAVKVKDWPWPTALGCLCNNTSVGTGSSSVVTPEMAMSNAYDIFENGSPILDRVRSFDSQFRSYFTSESTNSMWDQINRVVSRDAPVVPW